MQAQVTLPTLSTIVATLGPATDSPSLVAALIDAGVSIFRLNFSHGTLEDQAARLALVRHAAAAAEKPIAVLGDLPGPKIRIGRVPEGGISVADGQDILIDPEASLGAEGEASVFPCGYASLRADVRPGQRVLINDGAVRLVAAHPRPGDPPAALRCRVVSGGLVTTGKGINLPDSDLSVPALTERDWAFVRWAVANDIDLLALSFVRSAAEVRLLREHLAAICPDARATASGCNSRIPVIAKVEKPQAVAAMEEIVREADGIMVARGDLGVEMDIAEVPVVQKKLIACADAWGKPCIVATQMLESMIGSTYPTRAEVTDVANAVLDGADAVMLSGETAVGKHPVLAVQTMSRVIRTAEHWKWSGGWGQAPSPPRHVVETGYRTAAVAHGAWYIARDVKARLVVCWSQAGGTARYLSQTAFPVPILAYSSSLSETRRMSMLRGVTALRADPPAADSLAAWNRLVDERLLKSGWVKAGDPIVLIAGQPLGVPKSASQIAVHYVGNTASGFLGR